MLFRSNLDARIDDTALLVETEVISEHGRRTRWHLDAIPVTVLSGLVDDAPISWLREGTLSADVRDEWDLTEDVVEMDWSILFDDVSVAAPDGAGASQRLLVAGLDKAIALKGGDAEFAFSVSFGREGLETGASGDLKALWATLRAALADQIAARTGTDREGLEERIDGAGSRLRDWLDRRAKDAD